MLFLSSGYNLENLGVHNSTFNLYEYIETARIVDFVCGLPDTAKVITRVPATLNIKERVNFINERSIDPATDIAVELHFDSFYSEKSGFTVFHYPESKNGILLANSFNTTMHIRMPLPNRGIKTTKDFYFIAKTRIPAVLVELLFLDNDTDAALLGHERSLDYFANIILSSITGYYQLLLSQKEKAVRDKKSCM